MSMEIQVISEHHRIITDTMNPRIHHAEWKCHICGEWTHEDEVVWVKEDGTLTTRDGNPYCVSDAPEQPDY